MDPGLLSLTVVLFSCGARQRAPTMSTMLCTMSTAALHCPLPETGTQRTKIERTVWYLCVRRARKQEYSMYTTTTTLSTVRRRNVCQPRPRQVPPHHPHIPATGQQVTGSSRLRGRSCQRQLTSSRSRCDVRGAGERTCGMLCVLEAMHAATTRRGRMFAQDARREVRR